MKPRRSVVSPSLSRWLESADDDDRRTVVVRLRFSADQELVANHLADIGAELETPTQGSVVCTVTPSALRRVAEQSWVQAIDAPRRLFPRSQPPSA